MEPWALAALLVESRPLNSAAPPLCPTPQMSSTSQAHVRENAFLCRSSGGGVFPWNSHYCSLVRDVALVGVVALEGCHSQPCRGHVPLHCSRAGHPWEGEGAGWGLHHQRDDNAHRSRWPGHCTGCVGDCCHPLLAKGLSAVEGSELLMCGQHQGSEGPPCHFPECHYVRVHHSAL